MLSDCFVDVPGLQKLLAYIHMHMTCICWFFRSKDCSAAETQLCCCIAVLQL